MLIKKEVNSSAFGRLVSVACLLTVLSQLPIFVERGITGVISMPVWLLLFCAALLRCRGKIAITESLPLLRIVFVLAVYYGVSVLFNNAFLQSDLPYVIVLSIFILLTGNMIGKLINQADLVLISQMYILGCTILGIVVYLKYFNQITEFSPIYLYSDKNSTAQILMTAIILIVTVHLNSAKPKGKFVYTGIMVFLVAELMLMRSRATILFLPFLVCLVLISKKIDKRLKWMTVAAVLALFALLIWNEEFRNSLLYDVLYAGRDKTDVDALSSGRWEEWRSFFSDLGDRWLFGRGKMKRESLILVSFLEYGVIFGSLILVLAVYPLYYGVRRLPQNNPYRVLLICVAVCYALNGVFEQLAPFGPGVKCFFLWFLLGILCCHEWKTCGQTMLERN